MNSSKFPAAWGWCADCLKLCLGWNASLLTTDMLKWCFHCNCGIIPSPLLTEWRAKPPLGHLTLHLELCPQLTHFSSPPPSFSSLACKVTFSQKPLCSDWVNSQSCWRKLNKKPSPKWCTLIKIQTLSCFTRASSLKNPLTLDFRQNKLCWKW